MALPVRGLNRELLSGLGERMLGGRRGKVCTRGDRRQKSCCRVFSASAFCFFFLPRLAAH